MSTSTKNAHLATTTEGDPRWPAVVARDPQATFSYSVSRLTENSETPPSLKLLPQHVGISTYHFHRVFEAATGLTPRGYAAAYCASLVRRRSTRVTP
jgi:AraC family transcriptional regulator of adaptative response/methylated-DNA-[protein]-cysteine methyltransferase